MEEEREPFPAEDPRQTGMGDQLPEENPEGQGAEGGQRQGPETDPRAPGGHDPQRPVETDPRKATGNPDAAG
jgi:hypothetical protein